MKNIIQKPVTFLKEVRLELSKVSWSTRQELIDATILVIVVTCIMAIFIGIIDVSLSKLIILLFR
jgi:preprotein translocase subunit SecE